MSRNVVASLLANPHRTFLGLAAIIGAFGPALVGAPPGVVKWATMVASVCGALAALFPSTDAADAGDTTKP